MNMAHGFMVTAIKLPSQKILLSCSAATGFFISSLRPPVSHLHSGSFLTHLCLLALIGSRLRNCLVSANKQVATSLLPASKASSPNTKVVQPISFPPFVSGGKTKQNKILTVSFKMVLIPKLRSSEKLQTHATPILKDLVWKVWAPLAWNPDELQFSDRFKSSSKLVAALD